MDFLVEFLFDVAWIFFLLLGAKWIKADVTQWLKRRKYRELIAGWIGLYFTAFAIRGFVLLNTLD